MLVPLSWIQKYIKLEHTPKEFGEIMTKLEFMQDGPIKEINGQEVIDLEVRQNRPDMLSIIGAAREYGAYINNAPNLPESISDIPVDWGDPKDNLKVKATNLVKRFCTVEIKNIKVKESPEWLKSDLQAYGIPSINNIVDITNYVMLEYGMPLHAFDYSKLEQRSNAPVLTLRMAEEGEDFFTWQNTKIALTNNDLVVADCNKPVAIAGIIGGANSDIDSDTKHILLEAAVYDQANIRRTSLRHNLITDASIRHVKYLNPEMIKVVIYRALYLIETLAEGQIHKIEDFYDKKIDPQVIDFETSEIARLGGINLDKELIIDLLTRLGFDIIDTKEAISLGKNILIIRVPVWRTDINCSADIVEEVLRLYGYENIPNKELIGAPPVFSTPKDILLEEKLRDILISLGLNEYITNPLMKFSDENSEQIQLENPLNKDFDGLRVNIRDTLNVALNHNRKAGIQNISIFEIGKIYYTPRKGEYIEVKTAETLYSNYSFTKIKGDLIRIIASLGLKDKVEWQENESVIIYKSQGKKIFILRHNGYEINIDNLVEVVNVDLVPYQIIQTSIPQKIEEEVSLVMDEQQSAGEIADFIMQNEPFATNVIASDVYIGKQINMGKKSVTYRITYEDYEFNLTQVKIEESKNILLKKLGTKFKAELRA